MSVLWGMRPISADTFQDIDVENLLDDDLCDRLLRRAREIYDLGRNWQIVHYLLTGTSQADDSPLSWTIFGRYDIDEHSFLLTPDDVKITADALAEISRDDLAPRLRVDHLRLLYFGHAYDEDGIAGCVDQLEDLRDLYLQLARRGDGVLIRLG